MTSTSPGRMALPSGPLLGLMAVFALFVALIGWKGDLGAFISLGNLRVLLHENTIPAVLALGMLLVMISGGIDLSVGAVVALVTVVTMKVYIALHPNSYASIIAIVAGVSTGGLCGWVNGMVITRLRLPPFVATLGMLAIARGVAIWLAERRPIPFPVGARPEWVETLSFSSLANPGFWSLIGLAVVLAWILHSSVFGRHLYAVGANASTARRCGIEVERVNVRCYLLAGLLNGWAGILMFSHGDSGNPSAGDGLELLVIAAVVIGGAALDGGRGTIIGTLVGVTILGLLGNGVSLFNVPVEMQYILMGIIIIVNVALGQWRSQLR